MGLGRHFFVVGIAFLLLSLPKEKISRDRTVNLIELHIRNLVRGRATVLVVSASAIIALSYLEEYWSVIALVPIVVAAALDLIRKKLLWVIALTVLVQLIAIIIFGCRDNAYFIILPANYLLLTLAAFSLLLLVNHRPAHETLATRLKKVTAKIAAVVIILANIPELGLLVQVFNGTASYGVYLLPYTFSCHLFLIPAFYVFIKGNSITNGILTIFLVLGAYWCAYLPLDLLNSVMDREVKSFTSKLAWPTQIPIQKISTTELFTPDSVAMPTSEFTSHFKALPRDNVLRLLNVGADTILSLAFKEEQLLATDGTCANGIFLEIEWITGRTQFIRHYWITLKGKDFKKDEIFSVNVHPECKQSVRFGKASKEFRGTTPSACEILYMREDHKHPWSAEAEPVQYTLYLIDDVLEMKQVFFFSEIESVTDNTGLVLGYEKCELDFLPGSHNQLHDISVTHRYNENITKVDTFYFDNHVLEYLRKSTYERQHQ